MVPWAPPEKIPKHKAGNKSEAKLDVTPNQTKQQFILYLNPVFEVLHLLLYQVAISSGSYSAQEESRYWGKLYSVR